MKRDEDEDKCHVFLSTDKTLQAKICAALLNSNKCEKLLGVKTDNKLTFDEHIRSICKKSSREVNALYRGAKVSSDDNTHPSVLQVENSGIASGYGG